MHPRSGGVENCVCGSMCKKNVTSGTLKTQFAFAMCVGKALSMNMEKSAAETASEGSRADAQNGTVENGERDLSSLAPFWWTCVSWTEKKVTLSQDSTIGPVKCQVFKPRRRKGVGPGWDLCSQSCQVCPPIQVQPMPTLK